MIIRKILIITLLCVGFLNVEPAQAQIACLDTWFLPTDTTTFNVTCTGYGDSAGAFLMGNNITSTDGLNNPIADNDTFFGVSDFTNEAWIAWTDEDNQPTTDACVQGDNDVALTWVSTGACSSQRTVSVSATTNGVTHTPTAGVSTQWGGMTVSLHVNSCHAFAAGSGTTTDNTFAVTHGLGATPTFGIFSYSLATNGTGNASSAKRSIGFFNDNGGSHVQKALTLTANSSVTTPDQSGRIFSDRVGGVTVNANGSELESIELTANNSTSTTFTARSDTLDGDLIGLLCYDPNINVWVGTVNSPDSAAADWTVTSAGFEPDFAMILMSGIQAEDSAVNADDAGQFGLFVTNFTAEAVVNGSSEHFTVASNSDTKQRMSENMYMMFDAGGEKYNLTNFTATSTGFTVAAADITTANATTEVWPTLMLASTGGGSSALLMRRRRQ